MNASTFDALAAARELEAVGIEREHAEAIAEQLRTAAGTDLDQLATKSDLKHAIDRLELRLVLSMIGIASAAVAIARWLA